MKLKKLLKHIDICEDVVIFINEEDEPIYKGTCLDVPWSLINLPLNTEESSGSIYSGIKDGNSYIKIFLKEEE